MNKIMMLEEIVENGKGVIDEIICMFDFNFDCFLMLDIIGECFVDVLIMVLLEVIGVIVEVFLNSLDYLLMV